MGIGGDPRAAFIHSFFTWESSHLPHDPRMRFTTPSVLRRAINCHYSAFTAHLLFCSRQSRALVYQIGKWLAIWLGLPFPVRLLSLGHDEDIDRMMKCLPIWIRGNRTGIRMTRVSPLEHTATTRVRQSPQAGLLTSYSLSEVADGRFQVRLTGTPVAPSTWPQ